VGIVAAELPDVDYLLPAGDAVLHTLQAHRGLTHALAAAPVVALVAALIVKLIFRRAAFLPIYLRALVAVPLAHLLPDVWTGWGTRLWLPFSDTRVALDWTMVVDPWFTLPLAVGAIWAVVRRRGRWRRALFAGVGVAAVYLVGRIVLAQHLDGAVRSAYPTAASVDVFPAPLAVRSWRYVARTDDGAYAAGSIALGDAPREHARVTPLPTGPVPTRVAAVPTVDEALAWARFPVVRVEPHDGGHRVRVADLRYHVCGEPTLVFVIAVATDGAVREARLERGGSPRDRLDRGWNGCPD